MSKVYRTYRTSTTQVLFDQRSHAVKLWHLLALCWQKQKKQINAKKKSAAIMTIMTIP